MLANEGIYEFYLISDRVHVACSVV
jgi:hypothetical protein